MKKMIRLGLCLGLLSAALTCTALAADNEYTTSIDGTVTYEGGSYSASYSGTKTDNQYVLLVVEGTVDSEGAAHYSVTEDTIVYIDQQPATKTGVSFNHWIPMSTPDCVVLLGGEFGDGRSPKVLGTLKGQGSTVSGKVSLGAARLTGKHGGVAISLTENSGSGSYSAVSQPDGSFTLNGVMDGTYTLQVSIDGFLKYTDRSFEVAGPTTMDTVTLKGGDINSSGTIDGPDLTALLRDFGKRASETDTSQYSDINGSGTVDGPDLSTLLSNFGGQNTVVP